MPTENFAAALAKSHDWNSKLDNKFLHPSKQKFYKGQKFIATVVEANNSKEGPLGGIPVAKVIVHGVNEDVPPDAYKDLPWCYVNLGSGTSKSSGTVHDLWVGQVVEVESDNEACTNFTITKLLSFHKPKKEKSNEKGSPTPKSNENSANTPGDAISVEPDKKDNTVDVKLENEFLSELPIQNLATGFINNLVCGIFSKVNNELMALESKANAALERLLKPFTGAIADLKMAIDFIEPVLSTGILDFSLDMLRTVEIQMSGNCSIGNVGGVLKIDGWSIDYEDWDFTSVAGKSIEIDAGGEMRVQKGTDVGLHISAFIMKKKNDFWSHIDALPTPLKIGAYAAMSGQMQPVIITHIVVPDISKLNFALSVPFIKLDEPFIIGPDFESDLIPKFKFKLEPKGTDKSTFGQLQVISGPSELTPSLEFDFSLGKFKDVAESLGGKK
jgi:hypothetical protein